MISNFLINSSLFFTLDIFVACACTFISAKGYFCQDPENMGTSTIPDPKRTDFNWCYKTAPTLFE